MKIMLYVSAAGRQRRSREIGWGHTIDQLDMQKEFSPESVSARAVSLIRYNGSASHFDRYRYPK